jgi:Domain of unknown function (DUF4082)/Bacterial Ig domain/Purple acid Phosphatase, N-terminal domain
MRLLAYALIVCSLSFAATPVLASCSAPRNSIETENCLPGTPASTWDIWPPSGDPTIQGFTTDIGVNRGQTVFFKIRTDARAYQLDIYRIGFYNGNGARYITTVRPSVTLPQSQPTCLSDSATGLTDCGNWGVSASWAIPANMVSGVYIAMLIRADTGGASHIIFVVRDDASHSDVFFQTSDTTWQAYNDSDGNSLKTRNTGGGNSLYYSATAAGRAYKVSYNRPFNTRTSKPETSFFDAEYPMVRWLEANGYDVSYTTGVDSDRNGSLIKNHKIFLSVGHDEYWSAGQRVNVEAARAARVNLAFFSGNEIFWKTRWEPSSDASRTAYRTLVCYKETQDNGRTDPLDPPTWTGTWRDPRWSVNPTQDGLPPADGGRPENSLTGTLFRVNGTRTDTVTVTAQDGRMRFWRNTAIAGLTGSQTASLSPGTLGYEWDEDADNGFRPPGLFPLSTTPVSVDTQFLLDYGSTFGAGTATHHLTLYRDASGALVFGAGMTRWAWGLDSNHDNDASTPDVNMQQATVNLLADMGVQPATLQAGLTPASASSDVTPPTSTITSPANGGNIPNGSVVSVTGTATDAGGGAVGGVEVSVDGGNTWHPARGRENWSYSWTSTTTVGSYTIRSRAVDDSGNLETASAGVAVKILPQTCPCTIWSASTVPTMADSGDPQAVEVGVRFRSEVNGTIAAVRFYKSPTNTGSHRVNLWTNSGTLLATATSTGETASGWQQVNFSTAVAIAANTTYVASYFAPKGGYSSDGGYFASTGFDRPPLHALRDGLDGSNGVYQYGATSSFPNQTYLSANYWVDVVLQSGGSPPAISAVGSSNLTTNGATITWTTDKASNSQVDYGTTTAYGSSSPLNTSLVTSHSVTLNGLIENTLYHYRVKSADSSGSLAISGDFTFSTLPSTTAPVISAVTASSISPTGATINWSTDKASDSQVEYGPTASYGNLTTVDSNLVTSHSVPLAGLTASTLYHFRVRSKDPSNNQSISGDFTFTTAALGACPCTIWPASAVPGTVDSQDPSAVEVGLRFRADVNGAITGIRFYKSASNTGPHKVNLWTNSGTLLATATSTGETASGWQQVNFSTAVAIVANTTYVASYYAANGGYSTDNNYFATAGYDRPPLHALRDGLDGSNGVYQYGSTSSFPNLSYVSTNYWVDVVFK